ncbi:MAG: C10 family peptidase [Muribaculaceae bacterium]|nr:C10 family peptidase [Muribaculaceae bacterium]
MKTKIILLAIGAVLVTACNTTDDADVLAPAPQQKVKMRREAQVDYHVSEQLLRKYVNMVSPDKTIQEITPIVRNQNDTLAYIVQYSQGWDLISADTRVTPNLAFSETGILDMEEYSNSGAGEIDALLNHVEQTKQSTNTEVNATWKFLQPKPREVSNDAGIAPCGDVGGMWVPVDTQFVDNGRYIGHIIPTHWHQDAPYNNACPYVYLGSYGYQKSVTGCGPLACSQVIYKYLRTNNPYSVAIPANSVSTSGHLQFSNFSTAQWSNLTTTDNSLSTYITYLGQEIMGAEYIPYIDVNSNLHRDVGVSDISCCDALNWAHLQYDQSSSFNWQNIVSSLLSSRPIIVAGRGSGGGHIFIIDALNKTDLRTIITYEWRDTYHPDYWELQRNPNWMFDSATKHDFKGDGDIYEEEVIFDDNIKIAMNWGYGAAYDNVFYLLRDGSTTINPSWTVQGTTYSIVDLMLYNIRQ